MATAKNDIQRIVNQLPESTTWDDAIYQLVLQREIELGVAESQAGYTTPAEDILREFGIENE